MMLMMMMRMMSWVMVVDGQDGINSADEDKNLSFLM